MNRRSETGHEAKGFGRNARASTATKSQLMHSRSCLFFLLASSVVITPAYGAQKAKKNTSFSQSKLKEKPVFSKKDPVLLSSDKIEYDQNNDVITASGHVEISQGDTIILCDQLVYDQKKNTVHAKNNISMLTPSGDVYFADALEFQDNLKSGVIHRFKARLSDDSVLVANAGHKLNDSVTRLFRAAYTPCKCLDDEGNASSALWSIKAKQATIDNEAQEVRYEDAHLDVYDVPVMYAPYFSHAMPGADNESGLLTPSLLRTRNLGNVFRQPVYYSIAPDKDITLSPMFTSDAGQVLDGTYRQKFDSGNMNLQGSITSAENTDAKGNDSTGRQWRGNVDAKGDFRIDEHYNWGFNVRRASDETYLRLYNFNNDPLLTSRVYAEGLNFIGNSDRNYASVEALSFQGLTEQDNSKVIPVVAPLANISWQSQPGWHNSRVTFEGNTMSLFRSDGAESRRLSSTARLNIPYISPDGQMIEFKAQMRTDVYDVSNVPLSNGKSYDGVTGRALPQMSATWHYPFINRMESSSIMIEPVVNLTLSPGGGNPEKIPNEDSVLPEFTDANLFSSNRYAGYDRVENGTRASYGLRGQAQIESTHYVDWLVGQEYRLDDDRNFPVSNDLNSHVSDYVGKLGLTYHPFNFGYRFRLDSDNFSANRSEWDAGYNQYPFAVNASYLSLKDDPVLATREVINANTSINLTDEWSITASGSRDMLLDQTVGAYSGIVYKNECLTLTTVVGKDYISLLDIKPSLSFWFRVSLKNLE